MKRIVLLFALMMIHSAAFGQVESSDLGEPGESSPPPKQTEKEAAPAKAPSQSAPSQTALPKASQQKDKEDQPRSSGGHIAAFWVIVP